MNAPVIDVRGVTHAFGPRKAVDAVTLRVDRGKVFGLVGPNGSGKTTLTRIMVGLQKATSGTAFILGRELTEDGARWVRHTVGYMSQKFSLYNDLTVHENLTFFGRAHGLRGPALQQRIDEVVHILGLGPHYMKPAMFLSGGWRQRLALGTTVLHRPPLMFLDEPTAGVDPVARRELWDFVFDLAAQGMEVFLTTQYMDEVERCGEIGYIVDSKLIVTGTPKALKQQTVQASGGGRYVEIVCEEPVRLVPLLRARPYCENATVLGPVIHALVRDDVPDGRILADMRSATGHGPVTVHAIEPSLEDVFVALTRAIRGPSGRQPR